MLRGGLSLGPPTSARSRKTFNGPRSCPVTAAAAPTRGSGQQRSLGRVAVADELSDCQPGHRNRRRQRPRRARANKQHLTSLSLLFQNANGLALKDQEIVSNAYHKQVHIIGVTETLLYSARRLWTGPSDEFRWIFGSPAVRSTSGRPRGGVAFAIRRSVSGVHVLSSSRNSLWISIPTRSGPLFVGVLYLPPAGSAHSAERSELLAAFSTMTSKLKAKGLVVVGGDLNARMAVNGDSVTNAEGRQLVSFAAESGLSIINATSKCTGQFSWERVVKGVLQQSTIDYCLASSMHIIKKMLILSTPSLRAGSDHKPILLKLQLQPRVVTQQCKSRHPSLRWVLPDYRDSSWDEYRRVLAAELDRWKDAGGDWLEKATPSAVAQQPLDLAARGLADCITSAASKVFGKRSARIGQRTSRLADPETKLLMERRDEALHAMRLLPSSDAASAYYSLCRAVRSAIRKRKRASRRASHKKLEELCGTGRRFWSYFRMMTAPSSAELPDSFRRLNGELSVGPRGRVEAMREYFEALGSPPTSGSLLSEPLPAPMPTVLDERVSGMVAALDEPVRPGEVHAAFACLRSGTAAGPDGIPPELVARGGPELESAFTSLLSAAWSSERWPRAWTEGITTVVHKKGPTDDLDNFRGLSLLNTLAKAAEYFIKARLEPFVEALPALHDSQGGFRPDRRCADQHFILAELCNLNRGAK